MMEGVVVLWVRNGKYGSAELFCNPSVDGRPLIIPAEKPRTYQASPRYPLMD